MSRSPATAGTTAAAAGTAAAVTSELPHPELSEFSLELDASLLPSILGSAAAAAPELASVAQTAPMSAPAPVVTAPAAAIITPAPAVTAPAAAIITPAPAVTASAPAAGISAALGANTAAAPSGAMDRDFIARNQIVERYLSGRLPLKGATDFERFCKENPSLLDELGLPERVHAGLRLLEASGKPEPWHEGQPVFWTQPRFVLGLIGVSLLLAGSLAVIASGSAAKSQKITVLQKQTAERPLEPATSTRSIRLVPSHEAASNTPAVVIGGGAAELVDLKIDETHSAYKTFRITIDRIDQGRVAVLHNLAKDSNGHLRIALNSSALGPGNYQLTIEGLSWRGDPVPDSWVTIGIQR